MKAKVVSHKFDNEGTPCKATVQDLGGGISVIDVTTKTPVTRENVECAEESIVPIIDKFVKKPTIIHVGNVSLLAWWYKGALHTYMFDFPEVGLQIN